MFPSVPVEPSSNHWGQAVDFKIDGILSALQLSVHGETTGI
jgi:hypothetical protein